MSYIAIIKLIKQINMQTKLMMISTSVILFIGTGFITIPGPKKPWVVPENFVKMANPVKSDVTSLKVGKELWRKHCQSCHGKSGKGDGPKSAELKTEPGNFTLDVTQKQSDGSLFYKISEGRDDMPKFTKKIPGKDDIWAIVNYIRTLKK